MKALSTYLQESDDNALYAISAVLTVFYVGLLFLLPSYAVILFFIPLVLFAGAYVLWNRTLLALAALVSCIFVVYNPPGLDPGELLYYMLWMATVVFILLPLLYNGQIRIDTALDKQYLLFILLVIMGVGTGILFSGRGVKVFEEVLYFYSGVMFYFVFKSRMDDKKFRLGLLLSMIFVYLYVLLRTYTSYRSAIYSAVEEWELNFARGAGNENFLLIGTTGVLITILYARTKLQQLGLTLLFVASLGAVVVTLTRSLWVVTILSAMIVFFYVGAPERRRMLQYVAAATVLVTVVAVIYIDVTRFILELLAFRFQSFGDGAEDLSLKERIVETQSVWAMIMQNPIAGWGFATPYLRENIIMNRTSSFTSYIHNGYLAIWFKLGIFGLLAILSYCVTLFYYGLKLFRKSTQPVHRMIGLLIVAYLPSAGLMNITSPVLFTFEGTLLLITFGCFISWKISRGIEKD